MFDLILESKKNKVFRFFNFLLLISFAWVVLINTSYFFEKIIFGQNEVFYDLKLIHNSLIGILNSQDVYEIFPPYFDQPTTSLPPYLLEIFKNMGRLNYSTFLNYFLFFQITSLILLFFYSYKIFPLSNIKYIYPFIYFFCFNFSLGIAGTVVGNIAVILYGIVALGLIFLYKKKILVFNCLIFFVSLFKFYFLIFYFLPIFVYGLKHLKSICIFVFLLILINLYSYLNNPELYQSWIDLIKIQTSRMPNNPWIGNDITQSFATVLSEIGKFFNSNLYPSSLVSNIFYFFVTSTVFISMFYIYNPKYRNTKNTDQNLVMISLGLLIIFLFYPRLMIHDYFLIVPVYYFFVKKIKFSLNANINFFTKFVLLFFFLCIQDSHASLCSMALLFFLIVYGEFKKRKPLELK